MTNENFRIIVEQYEKLVFSICFQFTRDYQEAENLAQETFIVAYTHIDRCQADKYKPWLCRIATNKAKDWLKTAYRKNVQLTTEGQLEEGYITQTPENIFIEKERDNTIAQNIHSLKEPYKMVSVMYFIEGKKYEEIALALKRPAKTVQTQVLRAREILKNNLKGGP